MKFTFNYPSGKMLIYTWKWH